jgi:hypothetical protein
VADDTSRVVAGQVVFDVSQVMTQLAELSKTVSEVKQQLVSKPSGNIFFDELGGNIQQAITKVQTAAKNGIISLSELQDKLLSIKETFGTAGAFDPNTVGTQAITNESKITDALVQAEKQRTAVVQSEQRTRLALEQQTVAQIEALDKTHYSALQENQRLDVQTYNQSVDQKLARVKYLYDMDVMSAQEAFDKMSAIYDLDYERFAADEAKKMQVNKQMYAMETEAAKQASAEQSAITSGTNSGSGGSSFRPMNTSGFGMSPIAMSSMMIGFESMMGLFNNIHEGLVTVGKDSAQLSTVFQGQVQTQQQVNQVTNDGINIAKLYGQSIDETLQAFKLWGRQYSEQVAQILTSNSTMLSIVDNLSVSDANKAVESSMQAMGMSVNNVNDAMTSSLKLIDSWTSEHALPTFRKDVA